MGGQSGDFRNHAPNETDACNACNASHDANATYDANASHEANGSNGGVVSVKLECLDQSIIL